MLVGASPRRVAIVGGVRIPFARGNGAYAQVGNQEMLTAALRGVVERFGLQGQRLDDVAAGAVMKHSSQWNLTRESVLGCGLAAETPGLDLQRACGTSLEAAILLGNKIALGQIDCAIAAGVDTVSDPPVVYPKSFQQLLLRSYRGKTAASASRRGSDCARRICGRCCRASPSRAPACRWAKARNSWSRPGASRRAEQDQLALESHQKAAAAYAAGFYKDLVRDYLGLSQDNNIRTDTTLEKLAKLRPVFDISGAGTLTAGNSTPMTDGASAVLLASEAWARERNLPVLAYLELRQGRRRRLHRQEGGPAHGAGLRGAANAERRQPCASGLRFLRNTRGLCRTGAVHAQGLGRSGFLPRQAEAARRSRQSSIAPSST